MSAPRSRLPIVPIVAVLGGLFVAFGVAVAYLYRKQPKGVDDVYALVFTTIFIGLAGLAWVAHRFIPAVPADQAAPAAAADEPAPPEPPEPPDLWERTAAWLANHGALPAVGVVTVVLGIVYGEVFLGESNGDDLTFHMAESARLADCIRHGDWDFWNPSANGGYASAYYYQVIPQLASAIPTALFDHHLFFFQLSLWLPHVLGPLAAYKGARLLGATPWQSFGAALAIGFLSGESKWGAGPWSTFGVGLYTQSWALAAFPLALGYGGRFIARGRGLASAIAWGTFVGLCHPFGGVSLGLALFVGVLAHTVARREVWRSTLLSFVVLAILALLAAAIYKVGKGPTIYGVVLVGIAIVVRAAIAIVQRIRGQRTESRWRADFWIVFGEPARLALLGGLLAVASMPGWLTMLVDYEGFGGFPHRVADEVGPGFRLLGLWYVKGALFDYARYTVLTWALPFAIVFGRSHTLRWLWPCAFVFAFLLGVGPHMGKTTDDLIPPVRFLGAMQTVLVMGIGISAMTFGQYLWSMPPWVTRVATALTATPLVAGSLLFVIAGTMLGLRLTVLEHLQLHAGILLIVAAVVVGALGILIFSKRRTLAPDKWEELVDRPFGTRTVLAAAAGVLLVTLTFKGVDAIDRRIAPLTNEAHRQEIFDISRQLAALPQGRKQSSNGAEGHWWNLLPYVYGRTPALLQMGGGGLQASPNYDFVFSVRDFEKLSWVYDSPYILFNRTNASTQPTGETVAGSKDMEVRKLRSNGLVSPIYVSGVLPPGPARAKTPARAAAIAWLRDPVKPYANEHLAYAPKAPAALSNVFDPRRILLWPYFLATTSELFTPPAATVTRAMRQLSPGDQADIIAEVSATRPTTFVIRESWHPRWRAYIDGKPAKLRRVTPDFPAIDVPAGAHWIALRFERPWWAHASWLAWPLVSLLGWFAERLLRRFSKRD